MLAWILAWILGCLLAGVAQAAGPVLTLKDLDGKAHNVNEFIGQGKWTILTVWASDCPICREEIHQMEFFHAAHKSKDAQVLGISVDGWSGRREAARFVKQQGLSFPNLLAGMQDIPALGAGPLMGTPSFYIYAPDGRLIAKQDGPVTQEQVEAFIARKQKTSGK